MTEEIIDDGELTPEPTVIDIPSMEVVSIGTMTVDAVAFQDALPAGPPTDLEVYATIVSTYGGPASNSYIDLTSANSFILSSVVDPSAWSKSDARARSAALLEATRDIDSLSYIGMRFSYNQALEFPRQLQTSWPWNFSTSNQDLSDRQLRMKAHVERATCWQALFILRNQGVNQVAEAITAGVRQRTKTIGSSSDNVSYSRNADILCYEARSLLSYYRTTKRIINRGG
jgi:hypothetical protein